MCLYVNSGGNGTFLHPSFTGLINGKQLQVFNLTSLTKSEDVLSATLHYYIGDVQNSTHSGHPHHHQQQQQQHRHGPRRHGLVHLIIWSFASVDNRSRTLGQFRINVSTFYRDFISWQWKDITQLVGQAKNQDQILIGIELAPQGPSSWNKQVSDRLAYILVYANDSAISEPENVVATLQRQRLGRRVQNHTETDRKTRHKRATDVPLPLQNNELPGSEYPYDTTGWDEGSPYKPYQSKQSRRPRKKIRQKSQRHKVPVLQFDEQTIKKARKKQWNEPRNCARRYLMVDFADIGWSEWIISPEAFEAYYCSGSCQFPMPKVELTAIDTITGSTVILRI